MQEVVAEAPCLASLSGGDFFGTAMMFCFFIILACEASAAERTCVLLLTLLLQWLALMPGY